MQHPYCYPGTEVYRNKLDIRDADELAEFERRASATRLEFLPYDIPLTPAGYREIHRYMLQDVYDWAGQDRSINTVRTGPFCKAEFIVTALNRQFAALRAEDSLCGLDGRTFAARAAFHASEINAIHPFLDGNGRTLRAFLERLAAYAGHQIDLTRIEPALWNHASAISFHKGDASLLTVALAGALDTLERQHELDKPADVGHGISVDRSEPDLSIDDDFEP